MWLARARKSQPEDRSCQVCPFGHTFAGFPHRDRGLVAFWVSTGARASELLGASVADVDL